MDKKKSHYLVHGLFWKEQMRNADYLEARKDNLCSINKIFEDNDLNLGFQFVLPTPFDWDGFVEDNIAKETQAMYQCFQ